MATDPALDLRPGDDPAIWSPLHAWRALGQLRASEAIEPLLSLLRGIEENDDDWAGEELPVVFGMIGIAAIEPLRRYACDDRNLTFARVAAAEGIKHIGMTREHRETCAAALAELLDHAGEFDPTFNALVISGLCELHARQHLESIERAFAENRVDMQACGELARVRARLGVAPPAASRRSARYRDFQIDRAIDQIFPPAPEKPEPDWMKDFLA